MKNNILVTGAFSFTGSFISRELLKSNDEISTFTNHPNENKEYFSQVRVFPYCFNEYQKMVDYLKDISIVINTYWIRFPKRGVTWENAISNSKILFDACRDAGVGKIIHISVTNPSLKSPYPYFKGKARVEDYLRSCNVQYVIIRPALIFSEGDILINNMAWIMRRSPVFGIFGSGKFKVQPISQEDLAKIVVQNVNSDLKNNSIIDAIGPETLEFKQLLRLITDSTGSKTLILPFWGYLKWIPFVFSKLFGYLLRDVLLTRHEMNALIDNLLLTDSPSLGSQSIKKWLKENGDELGKFYAHEINRHYK